MAWGGGLTGLGTLMAAGAGLGDAYNQAQERQRRDILTRLELQQFQQRQQREQQQLNTMAGLFAAAGRLAPTGADPGAGMGGGGMPSGPTQPGQSVGGGLAAGGALTGRLGELAQAGMADPDLLLNEKYESGGRNVPNFRYDPTHTAGGYQQITDTTWREEAPKAGASLAQYPTAMSAPRPVQFAVGEQLKQDRGTQPWDDFNPKLRTARGAGETQQFMQQMAQSGGNPAAAQQGANRVNTQIPAPMRGRMSGPDMVNLINETCSNCDAATKGMVLEHLSGFLDQRYKQEWDEHKFEAGQTEKRQEFELKREDLREQRRATDLYRQQMLDISRGRLGVSQTNAQTRGGMPGMVMRKYIEEHPEATAEDLGKFAGQYRREQAIQSGFGGGILGRNVVALNTVADHIGLLRDYAEALKNNDLPRANQVLNVISKETGHPEVVDFNTAKTVAADEIVRLLTTTGGTEQDRKDMQELFSAANSPEQLAGAINTAHRFVVGRLRALEQQYARNDPAKRKEFEEEMLSPEARRVFTQQMPTGGQPQGTPMAPGGVGSAPDVVPGPDGKQYRVITRKPDGTPDEVEPVGQ